jgi:hypothetical protein
VYDNETKQQPPHRRPTTPRGCDVTFCITLAGKATASSYSLKLKARRVIRSMMMVHGFTSTYFFHLGIFHTQQNIKEEISSPYLFLLLMLDLLMPFHLPQH